MVMFEKLHAFCFFSKSGHNKKAPLWFWYARDSPSEMPVSRMDSLELDYLKQFKFTKNKYETPWLNFFLSLPVWGIMLAWFGQNYILFTLLTAVPKYLVNVLGQNILQSGGLATLPILTNWLCTLLQAPLAIKISSTELSELFNSLRYN